MVIGREHREKRASNISDDASAGMSNRMRGRASALDVCCSGAGLRVRDKLDVEQTAVQEPGAWNAEPMG